MTYEEFRIKWLEMCGKIEEHDAALAEFFCECDYKRYKDNK